jgi:hypothetical protein
MRMFQFFRKVPPADLSLLVRSVACRSEIQSTNDDYDREPIGILQSARSPRLEMLSGGARKATNDSGHNVRLNDVQTRTFNPFGRVKKTTLIRGCATSLSWLSSGWSERSAVPT